MAAPVGSPKVYTKPKLLVCEGVTDVAFFGQLLKIRGISDFDVEKPRLDANPGGGIDKFGQHLRSIGLQEEFIRNVRAIVLASDNDDGDAFQRVRTQISQAGYTIPSAPREFVETPGKPRLGVLMLPAQPPGCLETMCYSAAIEKWPSLTRPLSDYIGASPASAWVETKKAKMAIECILAATCEEMPEVQFQWLWQKKEVYHIPLNNSVFDDIVEFLWSV